MVYSKYIVAACVVAGSIATSYSMCHNNCYGHGTCGQYDRCSCYAAWDHPDAEDCSKRVCPYGSAWGVVQSSPHKYKECSDAGVCNRGTGSCECNEAYTGSACQRSKCPNDCSGHGACGTLRQFTGSYSTAWDAAKIQICKCDPGYSGNDCAERLCPKGDDPLSVLTGGVAQTNTVQYCEITATSLGGTIVLQLTDWTGQVHTTYPLDLATVTDVGLEEAIQAIPNNVFPDVTGVVSSASRTADVRFTVTFTSSENSGPQPQMQIQGGTATDIHTTHGNQPVFGATGTSIVTTCSTTTSGNKENKVCAGRGTCDVEFGLCKCNVGFYGQACDKQTALQ